MLFYVFRQTTKKVSIFIYGASYLIIMVNRNDWFTGKSLIHKNKRFETVAQDYSEALDRIAELCGFIHDHVVEKYETSKRLSIAVHEDLPWLRNKPIWDEKESYASDMERYLRGRKEEDAKNEM